MMGKASRLSADATILARSSLAISRDCCRDDYVGSRHIGFALSKDSQARGPGAINA